MNEMSDEAWVVYKIEHVASGLRYFGCTSRPHVRFREHYHNRHRPTSPKLCELMRQYPFESFSFEIVQACANRREANEAERESIRAFNSIWPNGLNLQKGGCGTLTANLSSESRKRLSEAAKSITLSEEAMTAHQARCERAWSGETGELRRQKQRDRWKDPDFRNASLSGLSQRWGGPKELANREMAAKRMVDRNRRLSAPVP